MIEKLRRLPRPLFFLFAGTVITRLGSFVFPFLTIYLSEARGFGFDRVGLIMSVGSIGLLLGNYTGGWLTDRWSRKSTLIAALLINAAGFAALAGQYNVSWNYALFLFVGYFGSGMYTPAANTVIADLAPTEIRPFAYTVNYVCINLGMGLGPLMGGFLATISYKWIFVGDVVTSLACAALIAYGVAETRARSIAATMPLPTDSASRYVWLRHPLVLMFCLANFFLIGPLMGLEYAVPLLVKKVFLSSLTFVGMIYTVNAGCILALSFPIERWIQGRNDFLLMTSAGGFWAVGLLILLVGFSAPALVLCTFVWTIGEIMASIVVPSFIAKHVAPDVKGRFMALIDIVRSFAGVVCPIGLGMIWTRHSAVAVVLLLTALPVIGILCYLGLYFVASRSKVGSAAHAVTVDA